MSGNQQNTEACSDTTQTSSLFPAITRGLDHESSNIGNVVIRKTSTESRHGVLSVGDLLDYRSLVTATRQVLLESFLLQGLVGHDDVLTSSMAGSTVGVKDLFTGTYIRSEDGLGGDNGGDASGSSTLGSLTKSTKEARETDEHRDSSKRP